MNWILDQIFGAKLREETNRYLDDLMHSPVRASRQYADRLLA